MIKNITAVMLLAISNILPAQSNHTNQLFVTVGQQIGVGETRIGSVQPKIVPQSNVFGGVNIDANYKLWGLQASTQLEKRSSLNKIAGEPPLNIDIDYISLQSAGKINFFGGFYASIGGYYSWAYQKNIRSEVNPLYAHYIDSTMLKIDRGVTASVGYNFLKSNYLFLAIEFNYKGGVVQIFEPSFPTAPSHGLPASVYGNGINRLVGFSFVLKGRVYSKTLEFK